MANLTQRFGARLAVDRLSLSIPPGMFYGIVGPNDAGKTTALTAMCGLRRPTAGSVRVAGHDLRTAREAALAQLGVMMDGLSLPERLTAGEVLRYSAGLRGLDGGWRARAGGRAGGRAGDLLEILGLDAVPRTLRARLSGLTVTAPSRQPLVKSTAEIAHQDHRYDQRASSCLR
ncbi:ATP-binding cassette domain-containing protein [Streptomyces coelicoflavus]|uniref:ATP-binding cassette domain-containing protein n=1 Tax=Streptomyces coelicoflavus TaxID=285562 RepID=UPI0024AD43C0|nr:ATP-binding cassette domain-containing protein [Streptomyces coelicoflavus]MDI6520096.1 ATP-binding cassette domain-containing protein [Streptomyces coelicoflavus]